MAFFRNLVVALTAICANAQTTSRPTVVLDGQAAQVVVDLGGGSIVQFQFKDQRLNPLSWNSGDAAPAHAMGHFLCLDRWGAPSQAESQNGMPFHGEASHVTWNVAERPNLAGGVTHMEMGATLPMARASDIKRRMRPFDAASALLCVSESVTTSPTRKSDAFACITWMQHPSHRASVS